MRINFHLSKLYLKFIGLCVIDGLKDRHFELKVKDTLVCLTLTLSLLKLGHTDENII